MTAEILILNENNIILAADSAVTIGDKVKTDAIKIFNINNNPSMAMMIYGNSKILEIPYETIINDYQKKPKNLNTTDEIMKDFIKFLEEKLKIYKPNYKEISKEITKQFYNDLKALSLKIDNLVEYLKLNTYTISDKLLSKFNDKFFTQNHLTIIEKIYHENFTNENKTIIIPLLKKLFITKIPTTQIIITGFNKNEAFPSYSEYEIYDYNEEIITNLVSRKNNHSEFFIKSFGEINAFDEFFSNINYIFVEKIIDYNEDYLISTNCLNCEIDEIINYDYLNGIDLLISNEIEDSMAKIQNSIKHLSLKQLIKLCEAIINSISCKQKIFDEINTVGGEINIAIINNNDGFKWFKKANYLED